MWNTVDIDSGHSDAGRIALDWPVMVKLVLGAACTLVGAIGIIMDVRVRRLLMVGPGLLLSLLAVVLVTTSMVAYSEVANVCRAAALLYVGYLLFVPTALAVLGLRTIIIASLIGMLVNVSVCWFLYLFVPEIGVFRESLGLDVMATRMGGLGHPNAVGRMAVLSGVLSLAMLRSRVLSPRWTGGRLLLYFVIAFAIATAAATFSRTSMVAGFVAGVFLMFDKVNSRAGMAVVMSAIVLVGVCFVSFELVAGGTLGDSLLSVATKTGDVEELTSATGRTRIWAEAVGLIMERPLTGWGLNSAPVLLEAYSRHTHNILLHVTFSGGVFAGLLMIGLLAWNFFCGLSSEEPLVRAVSMYVLVSGIFEDTVLDTFASPSTLLWLLVLLHPAMTILARSHSTHPEEAVYTEPSPA